MSKPNSPRLVAANESFATVRGIKGSHTKAQLVLDIIRGKSVERALNDLTFSRKKLAAVAKKALQSAIANAEHNHSLNVDKLVVARAYADKGTVMKRWNPRARGRAAPIQKARCHLTIVVAEQEPKAKAVKPASKPAAAKAETTTEKTEA